MADELIIGRKPAKLTLELQAGGDCTATLQTKDGSDWGTGVAIYLVVDLTTGSPVRTDAVISGADAEITIDSTVVDDLIENRQNRG